jgi:GntR family transcriptional regulator
MEFADRQAIYLQIADKVCEFILSGKWANGERIPAVREIAVMMEVNPNTANRAYDHLQNVGIIFNKRGIGYFVTDDGRNKTIEYKRTQFLEEEVPKFLTTMKLLGLSCSELEQQFEDNFKNNK